MASMKSGGGGFCTRADAERANFFVRVVSRPQVIYSRIRRFQSRTHTHSLRHLTRCAGTLALANAIAYATPASLRLNSRSATPKTSTGFSI